jgi:hypothetical protein
MSYPDPMDEAQLLRLAREKASKLLESLIAQRDDLERVPLQTAPDQWELGRKAFENAIASARRTLQGIDDAIRCAARRD